MEKRYEIIGWLDDAYGKWTVYAGNAEQAVENLKAKYKGQDLVVMAVMSTM